MMDINFLVVVQYFNFQNSVLARRFIMKTINFEMNPLLSDIVKFYRRNKTVRYIRKRLMVYIKDVAVIKF